MNVSIRFSLIYIFIVVAITSLYINITKELKEQVILTKSELDGVEYLKAIYALSISTSIYVGALDVNDDPINLSVKRKAMIDDINSVYVFRQKHPQFKNETMRINLQKIEASEFSKTDYYEFLDYLNHENYRIGDISKLLFEKERKLYFLSSLITHYMPEYLISLHTVNNIFNEYIQKGKLSTFKTSLYTEQNKLVALSVKEIYEIIQLLKPYEDTEELKPLINEIINEINHLSKDMGSFQALDQLEHITLEHINAYHKLLGLTYQLNDSYMKIFESNLNKREEKLLERIMLSKLILGVILLFISTVTFYWYREVISNLKKDIEIKNINKILDQHVIYSKADAHGHITYVSSALEKLSGFTKEELIGKTHAMFRHEDTKNSVFNNMWHTITSNQTWNGTLKNKKKDGTYYWADLSITPECDEHGEITGYVAYREDLTIQKALEAEKAKTQEALDFKSMFLSNMSHEIRTPLNGIIGFTYIALKTNLDEKQTQLLKKIRSTSDILLSIINDILDISKIEAGKMHIEKIAFNLKDSIQHIEELFDEKVKEKNITFVVDYGNIQHFDFLGDPLRITQVLTNLLNNAVKFTAIGGVVLRVKDLGSNTIRFEVEDTGIGLKEEEMKLLFLSFSQADMSTSRKFGGTGLGLAICKNLVEMMGGTISVNSDFGVGSTFRFELPLETIEHQSLQQKEVVSVEDNALEEEVNALVGINILVAEDNKMNQMLLEMLLEESNLILDFAQDGQVAVNKFEQKQYDLVLMDIQMPYMNGYQATQAIRNMGSKIPIVALSANVMQEDIQKAYDAGMDDYLAKPIEIEKLYEVLLKYLKK
ncbi:ATP-binding protein [Campylobacterota bacterium]